jgi:ABC-2 type transport system permease protein
VTALFDIYAQQLKTSLAFMLQYRASLVIWIIGQILEPLVYLVVWTTVSSARGSVGGYGTAEFAGYYIVLMLVNHLTYTWIMYEFEYRVRKGTLSFALLRPVHPIHPDVADNVASKIVTFPIMLVVAAGLAALFRPEIHPAPWAAALFVPAVLLAFLLRFVLEWTLALAAFWTTRVGAINQSYFVLVLFFSGAIAPLGLLPFPIREVAGVLPFRWMVAFPVELLLGRLTPAEAAIGLAAEAAWIVVALVLVRIVWRAGARVYSAVGA